MWVIGLIIVIAVGASLAKNGDAVEKAIGNVMASVAGIILMVLVGLIILSML